MIDHCDKCHQVHEECVCIDSTNGVFAKVREHEAEIARLKECMRHAGLTAFMRDRPPEEVAEHLRSVIASHVDAADEAEAKVARMEDALDKLFDAVGEDGCCEERADFWHAVAECCSLSPKARAALKEVTDE